ncbi:potassium transporter 26-like [Cornus florida]|uniref:potassium transporter 26-like n=1 Tax=Cornus florida TaxID=4283 RepID=UPI00289B547D|nr:potassium transporter 26-like [Cornus florida]XP_059667179.1 potassium transporter 26-like [Cornus florida]
MRVISNRSLTAGLEPPSRNPIAIYSTKVKTTPRIPKDYHGGETVLLAFQSLGVVYGDLRTPLLHVFSSIRLSIPGEEDLLGIFSLIFWTLTSIALIKYVFIVLQADDHGEGGTFALYLYLFRLVNFRNTQESAVKSRTKKFLAQSALTFVVMLGICMVIGDGARTPATSGNFTYYSKSIASGCVELQFYSRLMFFFLLCIATEHYSVILNTIITCCSYLSPWIHSFPQR